MGRVSRSRDVRVSNGDPRRAVRAGLDRGSADAPQLLRAHYWSMMTLTTTGHVDIINEDGAGAE